LKNDPDRGPLFDSGPFSFDDNFGSYSGKKTSKCVEKLRGMWYNIKWFFDPEETDMKTGVTP
jgi:hypothetical protein